ncbi:TcpQ domain-containing protein [Undibacterium sp.]|uniref:TcpQ domain-containing protein n=1 Tax=Undibacterium sp. TaxID=1914977 RepID=UPI003752A85A
MKYQIILICALLSSSIATTQAQTVKSQYVISDERAGVTAYEYGRRTVLEFVSAPFSLSISDDKGLPVAYERISDRFYRTAKQLQDFSATINGEVVTFTLNRPEYFTKPTNPASTVMRNQVIKASPAPSPTITNDVKAPVSNSMNAPTTSNVVSVPAPANVSAPVLTTAPNQQPLVKAPTDVVNPVATQEQVKNALIKQGMPINGLPMTQPFEVTAKDTNLRHLLTRWGKQSNPNWELVWQVTRDIPLTGSAVIKETDFKNAVRFVTAISAQSGFAVKPCFHTNNVVRIVAGSEMCNANAKEVN